MSGNQMRKYSIFTKVPWDKSSVIYYVLLLFTSCLYSALFEGPRIKAVSESVYGDAALMAASIFCCLAVFFLLMLSKYVFAASCPILFYLGAVSRLYASELHLDTTSRTAPLFTSNETVSFFISNPENGVYLASMFFLGLALGIARFFAADKSAVRRGQVFAVALILAAGSARYISETGKDFTPMPAAYMAGMQEYISGGLSRAILSAEKEPLKAVPGEKDVTVLVIVSDRMSDIFFKKPGAMPLADSVNMNIFTGIEPCSGDTGVSMMCALTKASKENFGPAAEKRTVVSMFSSAGYATHWINVSNSLIKSLPFSAEAGKEAGAYEEIKSAGSPNPFAAMDAITEILENGGGFITVNIEGTLPEVKARYPEIFNKKRPDGQNIREAEYLNYMDFIDAFIYEASRKLENRRAIIIFTGLAGEDTEKSPAAAEGTTVFGIWVSPALENETGLNEKITANGKRKPAQNWIFSSIAGCAGLKSEEIEADKNICE